jgi:hypothetical protein
MQDLTLPILVLCSGPRHEHLRHWLRARASGRRFSNKPLPPLPAVVDELALLDQKASRRDAPSGSVPRASRNARSCATLLRCLHSAKDREAASPLVAFGSDEVSSFPDSVLLDPPDRTPFAHARMRVAAGQPKRRLRALRFLSAGVTRELAQGVLLGPQRSVPPAQAGVVA